MGLHPAIAAVRVGVRRTLRGLDPGSTVLVACSGGADSLALLAATVFEAGKVPAKVPVKVIGVTVDHGLQEGSADHAARVVAQMVGLGVDETAAARVQVDPAGLGVEAAARRARYAVLDQMAAHFGAAAVLLGHTRDDQAETVLLGLARGSGGRSLAGMRRSFGADGADGDDGDDGWLYARPLLDVARADTVAACLADGIEFWDDPHNHDPGFARVRVRERVLPVLEDELGPGIAATLARTADQVRDDVEALDAIAAAAHAQLADADGIVLASLAGHHRAIRSRVLRLAALAAGAVDAELFHVHVAALVDLAAGDLNGEIQLPGHVTAHRSAGMLRFRPTV